MTTPLGSSSTPPLMPDSGSKKETVKKREGEGATLPQPYFPNLTEEEQKQIARQVEKHAKPSSGSTKTTSWVGSFFKIFSGKKEAAPLGEPSAIISVRSEEVNSRDVAITLLKKIKENPQDAESHYKFYCVCEAQSQIKDEFCKDKLAFEYLETAANLGHKEAIILQPLALKSSGGLSSEISEVYEKAGAIDKAMHYFMKMYKENPFSVDNENRPIGVKILTLASKAKDNGNIKLGQQVAVELDTIGKSKLQKSTEEAFDSYYLAYTVDTKPARAFAIYSLLVKNSDLAKKYPELSPIFFIQEAVNGNHPGAIPFLIQENLKQAKVLDQKGYTREAESILSETYNKYKSLDAGFALYKLEKENLQRQDIASPDNLLNLLIQVASHLHYNAMTALFAEARENPQRVIGFLLNYNKKMPNNPVINAIIADILIDFPQLEQRENNMTAENFIEKAVKLNYVHAQGIRDKFVKAKIKDADFYYAQKNFFEFIQSCMSALHFDDKNLEVLQRFSFVMKENPGLKDVFKGTYDLVGWRTYADDQIKKSLNKPLA